MARVRTSHVLALDIGSSSVRSALFDDTARRVERSTASRQYTIRYTPDGGAELDAAVLLGAVRACLRETLTMRDSLAVVAACGFWHGLLGLDRAGQPATPIFTWADNRSVADAAELRKEFREQAIQARTGCMLRAPFWPAKMIWLRRTNRRLFDQVARWTSPTNWIFTQLFGVEASTHSMASGTGLYNLRQRTWDAQLCARCGVERAQLDQLTDSPSEPRKMSHLLGDAKIFAAIGDGAASNLGSGADTRGRVAVNIGTSAAVRAVVPRGARRLPRGLFSYVVDDRRLVLGGAISNAGNLREWFLRELHLQDDPDCALDRERAASDTLTILPFLVSERAPTWPDGVPATITGITAATTGADIFRAATSAAYYRLADILELIETAVGRATEVIVSGGALRSPASLALLADCLGRDVRICREPESSLRGAATYALQQLGYNITPLRPGRVVRHRPLLAEKHQARRHAQARLERRAIRQQRPILP